MPLCGTSKVGDGVIPPLKGAEGDVPLGLPRDTPRSLAAAAPLKGGFSEEEARARDRVWRKRIVRNTKSREEPLDRKSTRLNSSHEWISYAVFCLKKKKKKQATRDR